jgi:biotin transport system substrate-specific component
LWREALLVVGGSLLIALSAQVAIPLPFSPVPVTGQTLAVLLVGALLGCRRGASSLLVYLAEGVVGLPVFAGGGSGLLWLLGPTGGYLVGFIAAAWLVGWLCQRGWDRRAGTAALAMVLGNAVLYLCGLCWLARFVGTERVLALGLLPFVPGDLIKVALAALALPAGWRVFGRTGRFEHWGCRWAGVSRDSK